MYNIYKQEWYIIESNNKKTLFCFAWQYKTDEREGPQEA